MIQQVVRKKNGQSMLELLIALGIGVLVILALVQSMVLSMKNSEFAKNQNLATRYSQEAIEKIRSERDKLGWNDFFTNYKDTSQCIGASSWSPKPVGGCSQNTGSIFIREASFQKINDNQLDITVITSWTDTSGTHKSEQKTYLTRWQL